MGSECEKSSCCPNCATLLDGLCTRCSRKPAFVVIPARGGSKGLQGKNLMELEGIPMLVRAINAANEANEHIDKILVSSDDPDILVCANKHGARPITRPEELSQDSSAIAEAVVHAALHTYGDNPPPICIIIQPNVPIWKPGTVEKAVVMMSDGALTGVITAVKAKHPPEWLMKRNSRNMLDFYMGDGEGVGVNRQDLDQPLFVDGQLVACMSSVLLKPFKVKPLCLCGPNIGVIEREEVYGTDVDDEWDFVKAEAFLRKMNGEA